MPTAGLPLLMEYRCYPSDSGIGLNPLDISLAINSSAVPNFRAFSTGGVNTQSNPVKVNPDTNMAPLGGYNPTSSPPGKVARWTCAMDAEARGVSSNVANSSSSGRPSSCSTVSRTRSNESTKRH